MKTIIFVLVMITAAFSSISHAEIYKWRDKDGQLRYTDTPPPSNIKLEPIVGKKVQKKSVTQPVAAASNQPAAPAPLVTPTKDITPPVSATASDEAAKLRQKNAELDKNKKQIDEANAKVKAENCLSAKANLQTYTQGGRIYKMSEKGERVYMDDEGLKQGAIKAKKDVALNC